MRKPVGVFIVIEGERLEFNSISNLGRYLGISPSTNSLYYALGRGKYKGNPVGYIGFEAGDVAGYTKVKELRAEIDSLKRENEYLLETINMLRRTRCKLN